MKVKIMLDLDGVIANFYYGFAKYLNEHYGCSLNPEIDPKEYGFDKWGCGVENIDFDTACLNWIKQDGFKKLSEYVGASNFVSDLMKTYDVFFVTARVGDWEATFPPEIKNIIKKNTYDWFKKRGIPVSKLYFIKDKIPFCQEHGISIMIEDKLETALKGAKNGISTILMNRGYNGSKINRFKIYRVFGFDEALEQLKKLASD